MGWDDVYRELAAAPPGTLLRVRPGELEAPATSGAIASTGLGPGPHWRFAPDAECRGLHVRETDDGFEAHLDQVHPSCSVVEHLRIDAPGAFVAAGAGVGAIAGGMLRGAPGAIVGGALGFAASALLTRR